MTLLIVEDNPGDADLVRESLEQTAGALVHTEHVTLLAQALGYLATKTIDAVLLDLSLPDATGLEALEKLHGVYPGVPIVVLTGVGDQELGARAVQEGAQDYLLKGELFGPLLYRALRYAVERQKTHERTLALAQERAARLEAEAARNRATILAESTRLLGSSLDAEVALTELAKVLVPVLGDLCLIQTAEHRSPSGTRCEDCLKVGLSFPALPHLPGQRTTQPESGATVYEQLSEGMLARLVGSTETPAELQGYVAGSAVVVPIEGHGMATGSIAVLSQTGHAYSRAELALMEEIGHSASSALANAQLYRSAQTAIERRDEFVAVASHELRTPLAALFLQIDLLRRALEREADPARLRQHLGSAGRQADRLARLVEGLLDVSRVQVAHAGDRELLDLGEVTRAVLERFAGEPAPRRPVFSVTEPVTGVWDRMAVERIIENLVSNALRYGADSPVEVSLRTEGGDAVIDVSDRGMGIPADKLKTIFDRFTRTPGVRGYTGLGLGLYIVRELATAQGGAVSVTSEPGRGSTFSVRLPLRPEEQVGLEH